MSQQAVYILELFASSGILVGLYALRERVGLAPIYIATGLLLCFKSISWALRVSVPLPGGQVLYYSYTQVALVTAAMLLVYTLEGTREAQKMLLAIGLANLFLVLGLKYFLHVHLQLQAAGESGFLDLYGRASWAGFRGLRGPLVSTIALVASGVVLIATYQGLINRRFVPIVAGLSGAQLAGMIADGLVFGLFSGSAIMVQRLTTDLVAKGVLGLIVSVPPALYIAFTLRHTSEDVRRGVLHRRALSIVSLKTELETVHRALEESRARVQHIKELFGRYVVPAVVDQIVENMDDIELGGDVKNVTVMFTDIRGYSTLSESMSPREIIGLLNQYFQAMSEIIEGYGGTILEYEGDAILTVFGAPLAQPDQAERGLRCAIDMLLRLVDLNRQWDQDGTSRHWRAVGMEDFRIRIGLHSGPVVVGHVGSRHKTKYAVIGDTVNTAARIESLNKSLGTTLLVSEKTIELANLPDLPVIDRGEHALRGRIGKVRLYSWADNPFDRPAQST